MPIEYYIGIVVGVISVLLAYVISKLTRLYSMCDKCKYMTFKDWKGRMRCREKLCWFYLSPKYCSLYKEREGTND